jgi:hypothetical protein
VEVVLETSARTLIGAGLVDVDLALAPEAECVTAITHVGPRRDLEERWRFFLSGL